MLRPSARLEAARLEAVHELGMVFQRHCAVLGASKWYQHFENWLWASRAGYAESMPIVPVLPPSIAHAVGGESSSGAASAMETSETVETTEKAGSADASSPAQQELARRLEHSGLSRQATNAACSALMAKSAELHARLKALEAAEVSEEAAAHERGEIGSEMGSEMGSVLGSVLGSGKKRKRMAEIGEGKEQRTEPLAAAHDVVARLDESRGARTIRLSCGETSVLVHEAKLHKLWALYRLWAQGAAAIGNADADAEGRTPTAYPCADDFVTDFLEAAFCALARLLALQGGHEAAGGMQLACPPTLFDALRADLGVTSEIFASPLNCRFALPAACGYCSASPDVDAVFGSRGSFFHCSPLSGAFVANPPFDPLVVAAMARRMEHLLNAADERGDALTFAVVVPNWQMPRGPHLPAWQLLHDSPHTRCALVLPKGSHSYCEQMDGKPTPSRHATSVMVLQSRRAARESPATEAVQGRLRAAFANPNRAHP